MLLSPSCRKSGLHFNLRFRLPPKGLNAEHFVPKNTFQNAISLSIEASYLRELIGTPINHSIINAILDNRQPLLIDEFVSVPLLNVVNDIVTSKVPEQLQRYFYLLKTQKLICQLLISLVSRHEKKMYGLNISDIRHIYEVKERLLHDLEQAPSIAELSQS